MSELPENELKVIKFYLGSPGRSSLKVSTKRSINPMYQFRRNILKYVNMAANANHGCRIYKHLKKTC